MEDPQFQNNDDDAAAMNSQEDAPPPQRIQDDDEDLDEAARAAAQVAALPTQQNRRNVAAEEALMGVAGDAPVEMTDEMGVLVQERFLQFLTAFCEQVENEDGDNQQSEDTTRVLYPYVEQARHMARKQLAKRGHEADEDNHENGMDGPMSQFGSTLWVDVRHILRDDAELAEAIQGEFLRFEPYLRQATQSLVQELHPELEREGYNMLYFVAFFGIPQPAYSVRQLRTDRIGHLSALKGTVTRTSEVRPELLAGSFRCLKCGLLAARVPQQYHLTRPSVCRNPRCKNDSPLQFCLETSTSELTDWQKLRVQESSDEIPPGSMPRSMDVICRHEMVERCKAGDPCLFYGSLVVIPDGSALARTGEVPRSIKSGGDKNNSSSGVQGLKALGVRELTYRTCFVAVTVLPAEAVHRPLTSWLFQSTNGVQDGDDPTAEQVVLEMNRAQRQEIREMSGRANLYQDLVASLCPNTFGHSEIKKGLLLLLAGGVHKTTADGIRLRGDINVCITGDPSTAKSQFLQYVHSFFETRSVYASGKASSAAGLTAAVQRDPDTGEYCIEAGALMLADNGICCIDEFDKMDPTDQVAIHEAMEQQTISITKAGIQATLNARASILAAANPIYGRYDRTKTLKANVALSAPILSRFDLFYVVLDDCNPQADRRVAQHILNVHRSKWSDRDNGPKPPFSKEQMQRYIRFCRTVNPKLTAESQRVLVDCYRKLRQGDTLGRSRSAYRITVRQLESMIRLSEAMARLHCDPHVQPQYVREAFRLLKTSIIQVETSDVDMEDDDDEAPEGEAAESGENAAMTEEHETHHPGEYQADDHPAPGEPMQDQDADEEGASRKPKKKKTKISYEEYEAIATAVATHLRSLESEDDDLEDENKQNNKGVMKWSDIVEWYLEQMEQEIGDSVEKLQEMKKKLNLVIRRLVNTDMVLITIGEPPRNKREEPKTLLAVHPNYVVS